MIRARRFRLGGVKEQGDLWYALLRRTSVYVARWCVYKAPRVPGRSYYLLGSQSGTRRDDQVIGECCHDLPRSSEGLMVCTSLLTIDTADCGDRLPLYSSSNKNDRASRVAVRHGRMTFSNLSTGIRRVDTQHGQCLRDALAKPNITKATHARIYSIDVMPSKLV